MKLVLSDEQLMLQDAAEGYLAEAAGPSTLRRVRDAGGSDGFDRAVWASMAEMGWAGVMTSEDLGGVGLGHVEAGVIAEAMGRNLSAAPFLSTAVMGAVALTRFGGPAHAGWPARMAAGEVIIALALDETRRHAPNTVATRAERQGNGFRITGAKTFVQDGAAADGLIVSARTSGAEDDAAGVTLFLLPADTPGVEITPTNMIDTSGAARITFDGVEIDADAVLGEVDEGAGPLRDILASGCAVSAAELSGAAEGALTHSVAYLKERQQFGQLIGAFQALQHRAAHLYAEAQMAKSLSMKALFALDADAEEAAELTHAAKAKAGQVAQLAAKEAIQFHGGVGMTDAHDIGFYLKRVKVADARLGDANYHADAFARLRGY